MKEDKKFNPLSREGLLIFNNVFLLTMTATVFIGTFYPLVVELINGGRISVGVPFYNITFMPLMVIILLILGFVPAIGWRMAARKIISKHLRIIIAPVFILLIAILTFADLWQLPVIIALLLGLWVLVSAGLDIAKNRLHLNVWAMNVGHIGLALIAIGAVVASTASHEKNVITKFGETFKFQQYQITPSKN